MPIRAAGFGSKAETLSVLESRLQNAKVLPQICFSLKDWRAAGETLDVLTHNRPEWLNKTVIVRSSGKAEDTPTQSLAGHFTTVANVKGDAALQEAIATVAASFKNGHNEDQIFIQPMLQDVAISGVALTRDPSTGGHYYVVNYDEQSGKTDSVTSGQSNDLTVFYSVRTSPVHIEKSWLKKLVTLLGELEHTFKSDSLDVEFAVTQDDTLVLLQVRPLIRDQVNHLTTDKHHDALTKACQRFRSLSRPHPYLLGRRSVFGNMPDWNPAEAIGVRPRPLALSLYKELLTDNIWAYQRDNYGYRNLRSFPLLISFAGLPYIDVRVSFNSFIPSNLNEHLAERLVNHYISQLVANPALHDKVEFDIIYSCYTLDLPDRMQELKQAGFTQKDCTDIAESLRDLTNNIIHNDTGLWRKDISKIAKLEQRQTIINSSSLKPLEKAYWLIEDCKRYGTLPFAGLARAGFIAVQILKSMIAVGILSETDYDAFMGTLNTVSSNLAREKANLSQDAFLKKYGHLRPGTYDMLSPRYDEAPNRYFDWSVKQSGFNDTAQTKFALDSDKSNLLEELLKHHGLEHNVLTLFHFIRSAIEGREYAKFVFTHSLSDVLVLLQRSGEKYGFSAEELSYTNAACIENLYSSSGDARSVLQRSMEQGKESYEVTQALSLPPLITSEEDFWRFELPKVEPNFITLKSASGEVLGETAPKKELAGNILMIPNADPGYDWIFSHGIAGFLTMHGGANSHMAIRAGELGIPAVIGAGEALYNQWRSVHTLEIDCANRRVRRLR